MTCALVFQGTTDHDEDGCQDAGEDLDDDDDGVADLFPDNCPTGTLGWTSSGANDYDGDGCQDSLKILMMMMMEFPTLMIFASRLFRLDFYNSNRL